MTKAALSARKARGSFPEKELRALAQRRPDLGIDVNYVLTGKTPADIQAAAAGQPARLCELRGARSVEEVAALVDVPTAVWQAAEQGSVELDLIKRIIQRMDVDPMWLLAGQPPQLDGELSCLEVVLIENYRNASHEGQALLRQMAVACAEYKAEKTMEELLRDGNA